jgi:hypothetical protein
MRLFLLFNLLTVILSFNNRGMIKIPLKTHTIFYDNIRNITGNNNTTSVRLRRPVPPIAPKNYVLFDV